MANMIIESPVRILKAEDKQKQKFAWHAGEEKEDKAEETDTPQNRKKIWFHISLKSSSLPPEFSMRATCVHNLYA